MKWKCGYPPCPAFSNETKACLQRLGWTFKNDEVRCPSCAGTEALFPIAEIKKKADR